MMLQSSIPSNDLLADVLMISDIYCNKPRMLVRARKSDNKKFFVTYSQQQIKFANICYIQ